MLIYSQSSGELRKFKQGELLAKGGTLIGLGYSGNGDGKNNPGAQTRRAVGPIPRGFWRIGAAYNSANTGPLTIPVYKLDDIPGDDVDAITGRSAFRIHGDSIARPGEASKGCIIVNRAVRDAIIATRDEILWVVE